MEIRRIQKTGGGSFTVTLPKKWINHHKLNSRDTVVITNQNLQSLLIRPTDPFQKPQSALVNVKNLSEEMITREIMALYIAGADEIECTASPITPSQRQYIRRATQKLLGFEIISESSRKMVLRNIFDTSKLPVVATVERMLLTAQAMFNDAIKAANARDKVAAADVVDRDREIDKLYLTIGRQFHALLTDRMSPEETKLNRVDLHYYFRIARRIERLADHSCKIAQSAQQTPAPTHFLVHKKIAKDLDHLIALAKTMIKKLDKNLAHQILNTDIETLIKYQQKSNKQKNPADTRIEISLDRVHANITNMAEAFLDYAAVRQLSKL